MQFHSLFSLPAFRPVPPLDSLLGFRPVSPRDSPHAFRFPCFPLAFYPFRVYGIICYSSSETTG